MTIRLLLAVTVFFAIFCAVTCQFQYDCRRIEDCQNGGTCIENDCTCTGTFGGYSCGYDTALVPACTANPNPCLNGGTCYNDGVTDLCACPYGFFGNKCENETVQIQCEGNEVEFNLAFPTDFAGTVKLGDKPECAMAESEDAGLQMRTYSLTVDITGGMTGCNMSNIDTATNKESGDTEFTALFQVNYLSGITTFLDELYNLTCLHENTDIKLSQDVSNVDVVKENLSVSDFNETYSPVEMTILDDAGLPLTANTQLYVGDVFQMHVYLTDDLAYTDVLIETCTTNNTLDDNDQKVFKILDRACPTKTSKRLTKGQETMNFEKTLPDGTLKVTNGKVVAIEAFKFVDSNNIGIVCSAKVCKSGDNSCAVPTDCDDVMNQPPGAGTSTATTSQNTATTGQNTATTDQNAASTSANTATTGQNTATSDQNTATTGQNTATSDQTDNTETPTASSSVEATASTETAGTSDTAPPPTASRRRKRAVNEEDEEKIVSTILTVLEPGVYPRRKTIVMEDDNSVKECLARDEITAMVAVLGTTVLVLLISCFVLTCLALRRRGKGVAFQAMTRPKAEAFHIPRAHINDSFTLGEI